MKRELARIREAWSGWDDDFRFFVVVVSFDFGGAVQAMAPAIMTRAADVHQQALGMRFLADLHLFLGVDRLAKAVGKTVWVLSDPRLARAQSSLSEGDVVHRPWPCGGGIVGIELPKFELGVARDSVGAARADERTFMLEDYFGG